jgi:hypothetical protein
LFEYHDDPAARPAAVLRFRHKYRIQYPLLLAGTTDEDSIVAYAAADARRSTRTRRR